MKIIKITIIVLATIIFFNSCNSDDDATVIQTPSVTYSEMNINATFFQEGNSSAPTINWNGNQGTFSVTNTIIGLTINPTTGVLNWTKLLPNGTHSIEVVATNSVGQTTVNLTLNNPFQGIFTGTYNTTQVFFEIEFNIDGTMLVRINDEINPDIGTGTYTISNNTVLGDGTFTSQIFSISSIVIQSTSVASLTGNMGFSGGLLDGISIPFETTMN